MPRLVVSVYVHGLLAQDECFDFNREFNEQPFPDAIRSMQNQNKGKGEFDKSLTFKFHVDYSESFFYDTEVDDNYDYDRYY